MKQFTVSLATEERIYKTNVNVEDKAHLFAVAVALIKEEQGIDLTYQPLVSYTIHQG